jgi:poly-gamma-glutamate capsule biosynthesis protein CapA/YwtB (metallophosphatase superfamily)
MATHSIKSFTSTLAIILCSHALTACQENSSTPHIIPPVKHAENIIHITAVGDIMLGGTSEPVLEKYGYDYPFEKTRHLFSSSDIVIGNLEGPLTHSETPYSTEKEYLFKTPPQQVAPALKKAGFNVINLANNHIMDFGKQGLIDTIDSLKSNDIRYVGAGMNIQQARKATIINSGKYKIGFLSYSLTFPESFWATENNPGSAFGHEHQIRTDVRELTKNADIIVVSFHWGREKTTQLRPYQPLLAHAAIDEGADMIIGHHPHVLQAIEQYKQGVIFYSLGNYTFGSYSRSADYSLVATAIFKDRRFDSLKITPINVLNTDVNFQPQLLSENLAMEVIEHVNRLSKTPQNPAK